MESFADRPSLGDIAKPEARLEELEYRLRRVDSDRRVRLLLRRLGDNYPPIRHRVADELAALYASDGLGGTTRQALRTFCAGAIRGSDPSMQQANDALGIEGPAVSTAAVRQAACRVLSGGDEQDIDLLRTALEDSEPDVRYRALISLHDLDPASLSESELSRLLADDDREISTVAAQWLAEVGATGSTDAVLDRWRQSRNEDRMSFALAAAELIGRHGAEVKAGTRRRLIDALLKALEDERTASAAASALVSMDARQAIEPLKSLLDGWFVHPIIRVQAAAALIELGDNRGLDHLERSLQRNRRDVRGAALRTVGRMQLEGFRSTLEEVARSDDYHADTAVLALAEWGDDRARTTLADIATERSETGPGQLAERALTQLRATGRADMDRLQFLEV